MTAIKENLSKLQIQNDDDNDDDDDENNNNNHVVAMAMCVLRGVHHAHSPTIEATKIMTITPLKCHLMSLVKVDNVGNKLRPFDYLSSYHALLYSVSYVDTIISGENTRSRSNTSAIQALSYQ